MTTANLPENLINGIVDADTSAATALLERLYRALSRASEAAATFREPQKLFEVTCAAIVEEGLADMAWVGLVEPGSQDIVPATVQGHDEGYLASTRHSALEIPSGLGPTGVAVRTGVPDRCDEITTDSRMGPWRAESATRGYTACAAFPLKTGTEVAGALTVYSAEGPFDESVIALADRLAAGISMTLEAIASSARVEDAEQSLRSSEKFYRTLMDNAQDIIVVLDSVGRMIYISPSVEAILGYTRSSLRDKSVFDFVHPDEAARMIAVHRDVIEAPGRSRQLQTRVRHADGSYRFIDIAGRSFTGESGELDVVINARDVTDRWAIHEAQRKDRDFITAVINTTAALVTVFDSEGRIILFNSTCEEATGYSFGEVRGRTPEFLYPPQDATMAVRSFRGFIAGEPGHDNVEAHWVTKHGGRRLISWSNALLTEEDTAFVISTGIDITERRQAESGLKQSEERYRTMFESTGTAMCTIGPEGTVDFMNQEFERMTGFDASEIEGKRRFTDLLIADDVELFSSYHRETINSKRKVPVHFECRINDKAGNVLNVMANMGLVPARSTCVLSLIDVTKERKYEKDLAETAERLRHFLTVASHELRHPITIVKGYANTLTGYLDEMPKDHVLEILGDIDASTDRLTRYVEELMDVSRVEEGRFPILMRQVDTEEVITMTLEDMIVMGVDNAFTTTVAPEVKTIRVDPEKFVQLLVILLENAVKFSPPASPVEIELKRQGDRLAGAVLDRGIGIGESDRVKVFDRFYQVEDTMHHSTPGMGLGLYIAREIVTAHGGTIYCEPREGGGTVFRFTLPLEEEPSTG